MMPVIFLDFDGVLNNRHYRHGGPGVFLVSDRTLDELIDPAKVALIQQIHEATGAGVVVSSSWRKVRTEEQLLSMLRSKGYLGPLLGVTTSNDFTWDVRLNRAAQISRWVQENNVDAWIAFDDWRLDFHFVNFIQTSDETGLTEAQAKQAIQLLEMQK